MLQKTNQKLTLKERVVENIRIYFGIYAEIVFRRPWLFILLSSLLCLSFGVGFLIEPSYLNSQQQYALSRTIAQQEKQHYFDLFQNSTSRPEYVIVKSEKGNGLTSEFLNSIWEFHLGLIDLKVPVSQNKAERRLQRYGFVDEEPLIDDNPEPILVGEGECSAEWEAPELQLAGLACKAETESGYKSFKDLCKLNGEGNCKAPKGILFMYSNREDFGMKEMVEYPIQRVNKVYGLDVVDMWVSNIGLESENGYLVGGEVFMLKYEIEGNSEDNVAEKWEHELVKYVSNYKSDIATFHVKSEMSLSDELSSSTKLNDFKDFILISLTALLLFFYIAIVNYSKISYRMKTIPALSGGLSAIFAYIGGIGLCYLCGLQHTNTAAAAPFLILGVGVDDMFVIINSYALTYTHEKALTRIVIALQDSGLSITITTLTNIIAFAIGATSPYLAIRNFCLFTATGLLFGYIMILTFFLGILCLEAKREQSRITLTQAFMAFFPSLLSYKKENLNNNLQKPSIETNAARTISTFEIVSLQAAAIESEKKLPSIPPTEESISSSAVTEQIGSDHPVRHNSVDFAKDQFSLVDKKLSLSDSQLLVTARYPPRTQEKYQTVDHEAAQIYDGEPYELQEPDGNVGRKCRYFFIAYYGWFLTRPLVKALVILIFLAYVTVAGIGCANLTTGLDVTSLASDGSYLQAFFTAREKYFSKYGTPVYCFFSNQTNFWSDGFLRDHRTINERLQEASYSLGVYDGFDEFLKSPLGVDLDTSDPELATSLLRAWLKTPKGANFAADFQWEGDRLKTFQIKMVPRHFESSKSQLAFVDGLRSDLSEGLSFKAEPYNDMFIFYESDRSIVTATFSNMGFAAAAMLLVAIFLLSSLRSGLLVIFTLLTIDLGVVGFMHFWNLSLNMLTMVNLIISIGFAVDYSAHMCHTFGHCLGKSRDLRVIETLALMGNPVFHGALSTQLGVVMLSFSSSHVLRVFFKMITLVLILAASHALIFLPVILSLVGPMDGSDEDTHQKGFTMFMKRLLFCRKQKSLQKPTLSNNNNNDNNNNPPVAV